MSATVAQLYERLIERDLDAIPRFEDAQEFFLAVARFAVLAFAPSQHSKHAFLAVLAAHELREDYGPRWNDLLVECARYAAESRQPWSEPPILDPPAIDADEPRDVDALRAHVAARDRLASERWLAARLDDPDLFDDLMTVAADDFDDFGHNVIITSAAFKLAPILGDKGRYATLRCAVWEMTSRGNNRYIERRADVSDLRERLVQNAIAEDGSLESMHHVFLYEAAKGTIVFDRVCDYLASQPLRSDRRAEARHSTEPPVYRLARDYAQCLKAYALRDPRLAAAAVYNLEHAPSFADWSFA